MIQGIFKNCKTYLLGLLCLFFLLAPIACRPSTTEYHVSANGNDGNDGCVSSPFKTISAAADIAKAGDIITVHEGI